MDFFASLTQLLKKPFPETEGRFGNLKAIAAVSSFVTLFLLIFQPFGIGTIESGKFWVCLGFGTTTFLAIVLYEFLVGQLLRLKGKGIDWTFGKWLLNNVGILFAVSLGNFLFARLVLFGYIVWELFPYMLYSTLMIGIIPLVVLGRMSLLKQERKYQHLAREINEQAPPGPNDEPRDEKALFGIPFHRIRYVEALQNYVQINYLGTEGQLGKRTERATLKSILEATQGSPIVRCHRSFLVNRGAILSATGNAQGLLLTLADCDTAVPVSRSYVAAFKTD